MVNIVTDELVLPMLARCGIDKNHVELWHDYAHRGLGKEYSPYAKFYRDYASKNRIMVVSGLPKVNANGDKICGNSHHETTVGWELKAGRYITKPNIFSGIVDGPEIELSIFNDQPWGAKRGDSVSWRPTLFLNGIEQFPLGGMTIYPTDPVNENYHHNVIELNYGICKRQSRVIEGRFKERWIFTTNPHGDIRIKHNFVGSLKVKLGYARDASGEPLEILFTNEEELIPATSFDKAVFPVEVYASQTFYPDVDPETSSVDGRVVMFSAEPGITWPEIRDGAGNYAYDSTANEGAPAYISSRNTTDRWGNLIRSIFLFDTSSLPDDAEILDAGLSLYGYAKQDQLGITPDANIYSSNPASNTALVPADYTSLGTTPFSTAIPYASWNTGGYNDFTLNSEGLAAISKTGVSKYGARNPSHDVANLEPGWQAGKSSFLQCYFSEQGTGYKPKLLINYSKGGWASRRAVVSNRTRNKANFYPDLSLG